jgi:hypothetical protein
MAAPHRAEIAKAIGRASVDVVARTVTQYDAPNGRKTGFVEFRPAKVVAAFYRQGSAPLRPAPRRKMF